MPSWIFKAAVQGSISLLPFSREINYIFQRHVSKGLRLRDSYFEGKLDVCQRHIENYASVAGDDSPLPEAVIELGTGWMPIVPVGLAICGFPRIISVDINPLTRMNLIDETLDKFIQYVESGRIQDHLPGIQPEARQMLRQAKQKVGSGSIGDVLSELNIEARVADARQLPLEAGSIPFFVSNSTLEHIPGEVLVDIFSEFRRIATDDSVMSHLIDLSDHYSHFDKGITAYNFLKYPEARWRIFNNALHYQSRNRISDYREIHDRSGFRIVSEDNTSAAQDQIGSIEVARQFAEYKQDDLIVTTSWMVSVPR